MSAPERVRHLVLMGSAGLSKGPPSPALRTIVEYREPSLEGMRAIVQALTNPAYEPDDEIVRYRYEFTLDDAVLAAYRATQDWIKDAGGLYYDEDAIAKVTTPTLVVHGRLDAVVPYEQSLRFGELLDNAHVYVMPHCGHWAMIEHPVAFASSSSCSSRRLAASSG